MYEKHESQIAGAIHKISKHDRIFAYTLLTIFSIAGVIMASVMWELLSSLSANMQSMASNMQLMQQDMNQMSQYIASMDKAMNHMDESIGEMNSMNPGSYFDMDSNVKDMNHINPFRYLNKLVPLND